MYISRRTHAYGDVARAAGHRPAIRRVRRSDALDVRTTTLQAGVGDSGVGVTVRHPEFRASTEAASDVVTRIRYRDTVAASVNFDRVAARYDETRGGEERGRHVVGELAPHLPRGLLLEVGVGTGLIGSEFAVRGWSVIGIDLSTEMLARASRRIPGRLVRADAGAVPLADGNVDACVAVHVLHLVGDQRSLFAEAARVLRPGGRLAVVGGGKPSTATDIHQVILSMDARLPDRPGGRVPAAAVPIAEEVGLRPVTDFVIVRSIEAVTPRTVAEQITERTWSRLWDLSADQWSTIVQPAVDALCRLPGPDRPRPVEMAMPAIIFEVDPPTLTGTAQALTVSTGPVRSPPRR